MYVYICDIYRERDVYSHRDTPRKLKIIILKNL